MSSGYAVLLPATATGDLTSDAPDSSPLPFLASKRASAPLFMITPFQDMASMADNNCCDNPALANPHALPKSPSRLTNQGSSSNDFSASMPLPSLLRAHRQGNRALRKSSTGGTCLVGVEGTGGGSAASNALLASGCSLKHLLHDSGHNSGASDMPSSAEAGVEYTVPLPGAGALLLQQSQAIAAGAAPARHLGRSVSVLEARGASGVHGGDAVGNLAELEAWSQQQRVQQARRTPPHLPPQQEEQQAQLETIPAYLLASSIGSASNLILGSGHDVHHEVHDGEVVGLELEQQQGRGGGEAAVTDGEPPALAPARDEGIEEGGGGSGGLVLPPEYLAWHDVEAIPVLDPVTQKPVSCSPWPLLGARSYSHAFSNLSRCLQCI